MLTKEAIVSILFKIYTAIKTIVVVINLKDDSEIMEYGESVS